MNTSRTIAGRDEQVPSATRGRWVIIQRNPTSGTGRGARQLLVLIRELKAEGFCVRLFASRSRLDQFVSTSGISENIHCLVAAGGDGTIASLVNRHEQFAIAVLPLGTENLVARHLQIPRCGRTVAKVIQQNNARLFDSAFVNGRRFLLMASAGVDGEVVRTISASRRGNISRYSYIWPILKSFFCYSYPTIQVYDASKTLLASGSHVIVTNIPEYGFGMPFSPKADPHDSQLDVRVFTRSGTWRTMLHGLRTRLGLPDKSGHVVRFTTTEIHLGSDAQTPPVQYDGDPIDEWPVSVRMGSVPMKLLVNHPQQG